MPMNVKELRENAKHCERLARQRSLPADRRRALLDIAERWRKMAGNEEIGVAGVDADGKSTPIVTRWPDRPPGQFR